MKMESTHKRGILAAITTAAFVAYTAMVYQGKGTCFEVPDGRNSLGLMMVYGMDDVLVFFKSRTPEQLACYAEFLRVWDVVFAALYASMYGSWIAGLFSHRRMVWVAPAILAAAFDGLENFLEVQMLRSFLADSTVPSELIRMGSIANATKWVFSWLVFLILGIGLWQSAARRLKRMKEV